MVSTRWDMLLGELGVVATQIAQAAPGVYPLSAPRLGAHEESIDTAEERLGHPLDAGFRELLRHADGWPGAFLDGDVLGTRDLGTGPLWERGASPWTSSTSTGRSTDCLRATGSTRSSSRRTSRT